MKKILLLCTLFIAISTIATAQVSTYSFEAVSGTYVANASPVTLHSTATDDAISVATNIGFTFNFNGVAYTQFRASTNGFLSFNTAAADNNVNNLAVAAGPGTVRPGLAPLWDDLATGNAANSSKVDYLLTGTSPNRILTVEWNAMRWDYSSVQNVISFQIKLYETSNIIEYIYSQGSGAITNSSGGASIGLMGATASDYLSLANSTAAPTTSSSTSTNSIAAKPATGQIYRFSPVDITSFSPASACVGGAVTLTGTNFTGATSVKFNGVTATYSVVNINTITTTVPAGATTGVITVTAPKGVGTSSSFTVNQNATIALTSAGSTTSQTVCSTAPITNITYSIGGGATNATVSGLPAGVTGSLSAGTFTISGSPTASGTFNYTVNTVGPCATPSLGGTITVNPSGTIALSSAAGTNAQTKCINTAITPITYAVGGTSTGATVSGLPPSLSYSFSGGTLTISGTPTASGVINYTVSTSGSGCINPTATGSITVNADATISLSSVAGTDAQVICQGSAITNITYAVGGSGTGATVSGLPAGVNFAYSGGTLTISGTPTAFGTFNYTVQTTGPCVTPTATGTITVNQSGSISLTSGAGSNTPTLCINNPLTNITYSIGGTATGATLTGSLPTGVTGVYNAGVFTISGTPTASGVFNYTVTTTGSGCNNPALSGTITVNANATNTLSSAAGTDNQTKCVNNAITNITYAIGGSGTGATLTGSLPTGVTGSFATGTFTISGTPTVAGTFNYTVTPTGPCVNPPLSGTITVNDNGKITLISAAGTPTQTICVNTALTAITYQISGAGTGATIGALPAGVTGSYNSGTKVFTISGTPTVSGSFPYTVTVTGSLCVNQTLSGTITVNPAPSTPTAQPTNLILTPSGTTVVLGSFTAASPAPTGYLVVRTTTATAPTAPVNGTTYTAGTAALGGVIVSQGTGTTFASTGLTVATPYWYWVYSYNSDVCAVTPKYLTANPLTNSTTTQACGVPTLYWAGAGSTLTGAGTGTDFNTAANWSYTPGTVTTSLNAPISCDNINIALKSTATITLSAAVTVNNFTATVQGNGSDAEIDVNGKNFTINGNTVMDALSGNKNTNLILLNTNFLANPLVSFIGNLTLGPDVNNLSATPSACPVVSISEDYFSTLNFGTRGNVIMGKIASLGSGGNIFFPNYPPSNFYLDAAGTQSITWNNTVYYAHCNNVIIGNTNSPTVNQITGLVVPDNIIANLTINGSSVLNLGTSQWNRDASGGTFTMNGTSKLLVSAGSSSPVGGAAPGGIVAPGSNFPGGFATYTFGANTTQEYNSVASINQTAYAVNYGNLILTNATGSGNGTKNITANIGVISNLTVNPFVTFDQQTFTANRTTAGGGTFALAANSTLRLSGGTGGQTGSNFPLNFTTINLNSGASPTSTVEYYGTVAQTVFAVPTFYGHLTISNASTKTATAAITAKGNLTLNNSAVFAGSTFVHNIGGNWINNVGTTAFTSSGTVNFNGTAGQTIGGSATAGTVFNSLTLNNSAGATLLQDQQVTNVLTLTTGNLNIAANNLTLATTATAVAGGPFTDTKMIIASGVGEVRKAFTGTGTFFFPIGDNFGTTDYSPLSLTVNSGTFAGGAYVGVNVRDDKHPDNASPTNFLTRWWNVKQSGITSCNVNVAGTYTVSGDVSTTESQISSAQLKGTFVQITNGWLKFQTLAANTLTANGALLTAGETNAFTGISNASPTVDIAGGGVSICNNGSSVNLTTSVTGDPSFVYSWSPATGLSSSTVANPVATPTTTTTYTVTARDVNGVIATKSTTITVNDPVSVSALADVNTCNGGPIVINSAATGTISQYQWQVSTDGGVTFTNITSGPVYSGYNSANLTIAAPDPAMNDYQYKVVVKGTSPCGDQTSSSSKLTLKNIWTGNASTTDWNTASNWSGNSLPDLACATVYIPSRAFKPTLAAGTTTVKNIVVYSGATLTIPTGSKLQVAGSITAATGSIFASDGTVEMNGTGSAQSISGSAFDGRVLDKLINSNASGLNVSNTPGDELKITGSLEFGSISGSFIETGGNVTLVSTAVKTASVGKVQNGNSISGAASIERFLPAYKAWRFVAAPVKSATSPFITDAWREGGSMTSTGYGTQITGPATSTGMDAVTGSASLKYYNDATGTFTPITNNNTTKISNKPGYMIYVRGDRGTGITGTVINTNLRIKGEINTGDQFFSVKANSFQSIGNPYPAEISYDAIRTANPGLENSYRAWDASLNGSFNSGGYQTLSSVDGYQATAAGSTFFPNGSLHPNIQSGQAFYVLNTTGSLIPNMVISESMKVNGNTVSVSRENTINDRQFIRAKLFTSTGTIADGNLVAFDDEYSSDIDEFDAAKFYNGGENIGILHSGKKLSVDARARIQVTDTIQYDVTNLQAQNYKLVITATNFDNGTVTAYLMDRFANTQTRLNLSDSNFVNVNVTADAASKAANRLYIVFQKVQAPLPVTITTISASRNPDRSIAVKWKVENELNIRRYEVQRSAEGERFTSILSNDPNAVNGGSAAYNRDDLSPLATDNYYRIKAISISGQVQYSAIVKVAPLKLNSDIGVYPNPVANKNVQIRFTDKVNGRYQVQIINKLGQVIYSGVAQVSGAVFTQSVQLDQNLAAGNYQLKVVSEEGKITTQQIIIQ